MQCAAQVKEGLPVAERERETASNGSGADPSTQEMHTQHKTKGMHTAEN